MLIWSLVRESLRVRLLGEEGNFSSAWSVLAGGLVCNQHLQASLQSQTHQLTSITTFEVVCIKLYSCLLVYHWLFYKAGCTVVMDGSFWLIFFQVRILSVSTFITVHSVRRGEVTMNRRGYLITQFITLICTLYIVTGSQNVWKNKLLNVKGNQIG